MIWVNAAQRDANRRSIADQGCDFGFLAVRLGEAGEPDIFQRD